MAFDTLFESIGQSDRGVDRQPARHYAVEEHGFLLAKYGRDNYLHAGNKHLFERICRKLIITHEVSSRVVIMKNPWDYGHEDEILKLYPNAKFINIRREPIKIFNSTAWAMTLIVADSFNMYGVLLFPLSNMIVIFLLRFYSQFFPDLGKMFKIFGSHLSAATRIKRQEGEAAIAALPPERRMIFSYEELVLDPKKIVRTACEFIGLEPDEDALASIDSDPRNLDEHPYLHMFVQRFKSPAREPQTNRPWYMGLLNRQRSGPPTPTRQTTPRASGRSGSGRRLREEGFGSAAGSGSGSSSAQSSAAGRGRSSSEPGASSSATHSSK